MPSIIDTQQAAEKMATQNLINRITRYTTTHKIETVVQNQILNTFNLGPIETLDIPQLRTVLHLLPIAHLWSSKT